jgi:membrane associated rhomboid family serine protease
VIPLRDNVPCQRRPVVTQGMILLCALAFLVQLADTDGALFERLGLVPGRFWQPDAEHLVRELRDTAHGRIVATRPLLAAWVPDWLTLVSCTFLHAGWLHLLGNMLFLWIFGDNVEDRLGRLGFVLFYLGCGTAASAAHLLTEPDSLVPTIGASGAIAGVMGAYLLLYPHSRVQMLVIWGFFVDFVVLPAPFFLGYWFLLQFLQGTMSLGRAANTGGVAFWAHIGGFVAGLATAAVLKLTARLRPEPPSIVLTRRRVGRSPY